MNAPISIACGLAKQFEGCSLTAYRDPAGVWTIGWGETWNLALHRPVQGGDLITQETADSWLQQQMEIVLEDICYYTPNTTDNQLGACLDLAYNIGVPAFRSSTVLREFRAGNLSAAADAFLLWDKAHVDGRLVELPGLLRRREAERAAFLQSQPQTLPGAPLNAFVAKAADVPHGAGP